MARPPMAQASVWLPILVAATALAPSARGDVIKLNNGGEIRGTVERRRGVVDEERVTIHTLTGGVIVVEREHIRFITWRKPIVEEYETRARALPDDDVAAHWELAEWCRENGLSDQRRAHLERIVELEPDHEQARAGLGHSLRNGQWMSRDEWMQSQGYVKYRNRYITPQELDLIQKTEAERDAEQQWYPKVRLWQRWADGRHAARRQEGRANLRAIDDPHAVPALDRFLGKHADPEMRMLYVEALSNISGPRPIASLVTSTLEDPEQAIRWKALNAIAEDQYAVARPLFVRGLSSDLNVVVRRAAAALGRVGDETSVPDLIDALVTTHKYRMQVPVNDAIAFGTDGSFSLGGSPGSNALSPQVMQMIQSGQFPNGVIVLPNQPATTVRTRTVTVNVQQQNTEARTALQRITGEDHGFDARTWRLWWASKKMQLDADNLP